VKVQELGQGLWRWTATHPEWTPDEGGPEGWDAEVGCTFFETPDSVILIDPLVPGDERERFYAALDRDVGRRGGTVDILLTCFWHERSSAELLERYGGRLWASEKTLGVERAGALRERVTDPFGEGDVLAGGALAFDGSRWDEVVFWLPEHRTLVTGDVILGAAGGGLRLCPESWLPAGHTELREALRPLLALPVERVLVSHGEPVLEGGRQALDRVLTEM